MREILFRGKRIDNGEWVEGSLLLLKKPILYAAITYQHEWEDGKFTLVRMDVDPHTVGQYTGLTDKNGKRIFEGDILEGRDFDVENGYGVVEWNDGAWEVISEGNCCGTFHQNYWGNEFEIIGNIHDNPELVGGADNG